jgi:hypothetical protein
VDRFNKKEDVMHPVNYLFDEIMRHYWGIPQHRDRSEGRQRRDRQVPAWRLPRFRRDEETR